MIPQELISREEVIKILNDSMRLHSTPMGELINSFFEKRISKLQTHEDRVREVIEKQMDGTQLSISQATDDINSLQTIDPIEIIDAMIEELNPEGFIPSNTDSIVTSYLREAKERIKKET